MISERLVALAPYIVPAVMLAGWLAYRLINSGSRWRIAAGYLITLCLVAVAIGALA
jgi:hypothetical protein